LTGCGKQSLSQNGFYKLYKIYFQTTPPHHMVSNFIESRTSRHI